jgi:hypothetical protein
MLQVPQNIQALFNDAVALLPLDMGDKAYSTGIVFMSGAIQTWSRHNLSPYYQKADTQA